jgi:preprotein translocase subunit SecF
MKNKNNKKGQAAMEFLTTYGWAFLVIIVVIVALWQFGVFDTTSRMPASCSLGSMLDCSGGYAVSVNSTNMTVELNIKNNELSSIAITGLEIKEQGQEDYCDLSLSGLEIINSRQAKDLTFRGTLCSGISADIKQVFDVRVMYTKGGSSIETIASGRLVVDVA